MDPLNDSEFVPERPEDHEETPQLLSRVSGLDLREVLAADASPVGEVLLPQARSLPQPGDRLPELCWITRPPLSCCAHMHALS